MAQLKIFSFVVLYSLINNSFQTIPPKYHRIQEGDNDKLSTKYVIGNNGYNAAMKDTRLFIFYTTVR